MKSSKHSLPLIVGDMVSFDLPGKKGGGYQSTAEHPALDGGKALSQAVVVRDRCYITIVDQGMAGESPADLKFLGACLATVELDAKAGMNDDFREWIVIQARQQLAIAIGSQYPQQQQLGGQAETQGYDNSSFETYAFFAPLR